MPKTLLEKTVEDMQEGAITIIELASASMMRNREEVKVLEKDLPEAKEGFDMLSISSMYERHARMLKEEGEKGAPIPLFLNLMDEGQEMYGYTIKSFLKELGEDELVYDDQLVKGVLLLSGSMTSQMSEMLHYCKKVRQLLDMVEGLGGIFGEVHGADTRNGEWTDKVQALNLARAMLQGTEETIKAILFHASMVSNKVFNEWQLARTTVTDEGEVFYPEEEGDK